MGMAGIDLYAGGGGSTLGLRLAGVDVQVCIEEDRDGCETLRAAFSGGPPDVRAEPVDEVDLRAFRGAGILSVDPPTFGGGRKLLEDVPEHVRSVDPDFALVTAPPRSRSAEKQELIRQLELLGYEAAVWRLRAEQWGVPQDRRLVFVAAVRRGRGALPPPPAPNGAAKVSVGIALAGEMSRKGWRLAGEWARRADGLAPRLSPRKRFEAAAEGRWRELGINWRGLAPGAPGAGYLGAPKLTAGMLGVIAGFPPDWPWKGSNRAIQRLAGQATPPVVMAAAASALTGRGEERWR